MLTQCGHYKLKLWMHAFAYNVEWWTGRCTVWYVQEKVPLKTSVPNKRKHTQCLCKLKSVTTVVSEQ